MYIRNIKKDYISCIKVLKYAYPTELSPPVCSPHERTSCPICWPRGVSPVPSPTSLQRTKTVVTDYVLCNSFDYFCTFTYDPTIVDSFNIADSKRKILKWINNIRYSKKSSNYSPDLAYLIVPELHHSGRIHFHALFKYYRGSLVDSHKKINGRIAYNLPNWTYGYSTAVKIDNLQKVSSYMQKYITKDMLKIGNKQRYYASRNLQKPTKTYNINMQQEVYSRPLFITQQHTAYNKVIHRLTGEITEQERFSIFTIVK